MSKNENLNPADEQTQQVLSFENTNVRRIWHDEQWCFSIVDIVGILTESAYQAARKYWKVLKGRLLNEGYNQLVTKCYQFKLMAEDGKLRATDCANIEGVLRIIQSIPSKKAEPFKQWLAKVGHERLQEMSDPALAINRGREYWKKHGRSEKWIQQRMMGQETRNKLTDYWKNHDIKEGQEFAILTNIIHEEWSGLSVKGHKELKGLSTQNLRDHMSEEELVFTALAELSTRRVAEKEDAIGMSENKEAAKTGGGIARNAKIEFEVKTNQKVVSGKNYLSQQEIKPRKIGIHGKDK
jgi:prophage antirepressor-like protein